MQKGMFKKGLVLAIIVCFVGASIVPCIAGYDKDVGKIEYIKDENETIDMKNDDYNNLIKQVIKSGVISNNAWLEQDKLLASDGATGDYFGVSVSIDGDYAIIGAHRDDDNGEDSGSAYIFTRSGTTWNQQDKLIPSDGAAEDLFGNSVSIDGDYAIIGAFWDDDNGDLSGSAYIFTRDGTTWIEQDKLIPSDGAAGDRFGCSVSIDGDYAIIGAWFDDNGEDHGSAYIFTRDGGTWIEQDKLIPSDGADRFGCSVSIDGDYAIIGAHYDDDYGYWSGSAYIFVRNQPPNVPTITGKTNGKSGTEYEYTFKAEDPDGEDVKYHIDWGDSDTDTTAFSPSGIDVKVKHTWDEAGFYTIRATAEDINGLVGPEGTLSVSMPKNKMVTNLLFLRLLKQFPGFVSKVFIFNPLSYQNH